MDTTGRGTDRLLVVSLWVHLVVTGLVVVFGSLASVPPELRAGLRPPVAVAIVGVLAQVAVWAWHRGRIFDRPAWAAAAWGLAIVTASADLTGIALFQVAAAAFTVAAALPVTWAVVTVAVGVVVLAVVEVLGAPDLRPETAWGFAGVVAALCLLTFTFGRVHRAQRVAFAELHRTVGELRASGERVRELSLQQERTRTAGELHDGLGHKLTALVMNLNVATSLRAEKPQEAWQKVEEANRLAGESLQGLRRWVRAVGAARPAGAWGPDAVASLVAGFASTTLEVTLDVVGEPAPLPEVTEVTLFRFVQEALTNVVKHADAQRVRIGLCYEPDRIVATVEDDGLGLDGPVEDVVGRGFGLRSLRGRVADFGGDLVVEEPSSGGFRLVLTGPRTR